MKANWREWLPLPTIALIGALLLTGVYLAISTRITTNQHRTTDSILLDALTLPADTALIANGSTDDRELLSLREPRQFYLARRNGQVIAIILPLTARDGYNGAIDLIAAIATDGKIINVRAIAHRETPGLGDRIDIDKNDWIKQFVGKSLREPLPEQWKLRDERGVFDQITGATITSRAVVHAVYQALQYFEFHREQLLQKPIEREASNE